MAKYKRIAIIGGGPAGLAMAKGLALEPESFDVDLYEQRDSLGGLWYYTGHKRNGLEDWDDLRVPISVEDEMFSPMYKYLETNIPTWLMQYANYPFARGTFMYPRRDEVLGYLQGYVGTVPNHTTIHLNSKVVSMEKVEGNWHLEIQNLGKDLRKDGRDVHTEKYDAIVVANGHFDVPYIPEVDGLNSWNRTHKSSITHAKYFDDPEYYRGKTVLVVGGSASGTDIALQISVSARKVYVSVRDKANAPDLSRLDVTPMLLITNYNAQTRSVSTVDGETFSGIDYIVFCTGYLYSLPFLKSFAKGQEALITDGAIVRNLYQQMFYVYDPSLVFLALPKFIVPMPLSESQAAVVSRVFSNRMNLPSKKDMIAHYQEEFNRKGNKIHNLKFPADADYCRDLQSWIDSFNCPDGLQAPIWDEKKYKQRSQTSELKAERIKVVTEHAKKLKDKGLPFSLLEPEP